MGHHGCRPSWWWYIVFAVLAHRTASLLARNRKCTQMVGYPGYSYSWASSKCCDMGETRHCKTLQDTTHHLQHTTHHLQSARGSFLRRSLLHTTRPPTITTSPNGTAATTNNTTGGVGGGRPSLSPFSPPPPNPTVTPPPNPPTLPPCNAARRACLNCDPPPAPPLSSALALPTIEERGMAVGEEEEMEGAKVRREAVGTSGSCIGDEYHEMRPRT